MCGSINIAARRSRLLALAVGAMPLSLCASASAGTYWNDTAWSQTGTFTWLNSGDWTSNWPDAALWPQAGNRRSAVNSPDITLILPNDARRAIAVTDAREAAGDPAIVRSASPASAAQSIVAPALSLYSWDAALPQAKPGQIFLKVDDTTGDADFGDVILQGDNVTLYTLLITSPSGSLNPNHYNSLANQYAGGGSSEAGTLRGVAVDNTTNHSGNFAVFSQTSSKINEAGLGVTLDFTTSAQSIDLSTLKNNKNLFSGATDDLVFQWSGSNAQLVNGTIYYSSDFEPAGPPSIFWKSSVANGNWSDGTNWSATSASGTDNAGEPGYSSNVFIIHSDNVNRVITLDDSLNIVSLQIGNTGGGTDTFSQTASYALTMTTETVGAGVGGVGVHNQSAGRNSLSGALMIAAGTDSVGTYNLSGGILNAKGGVYVGGTSTGPGGVGTLAISSAMTVTGGLTVYFGSTLSQTGGALNIDAATINTSSAVVIGNGSAAATLNLTGGSAGAGYSFTQGLTISAGATLIGGGTITNATASAPVTVSGTIAPTPALSSININGTLTLEPAATTLIAQVGSTPSFASVTSTGNISLGGALDILEYGANVASTMAGQSFVILSTTSGTLSGGFSDVTSGQRLTTTDGEASFVVTINGGADGDVVLSGFELVSNYWKDGIVAGNWSNGNNWSATASSGSDNSGPPRVGTGVYITHSDALSRVITLDENDTILSLQISNTGGGTDTLSQTSPFNLTMTTEQLGVGTGGVGVHNQSAGTNTYSGALIVGLDGGSIGTYNLSGTGSVTVTGGIGTLGMCVGYNGSGTFNQSAGTVTLNGSALRSNLYLGYNSSGAGNYSQVGGTLSALGNEYVGYQGAGTFTQSGGTNTAGLGLIIGSGGPGTYNLSAGTFTVTGGIGEIVGDGGAGTFDQAGGVNNASSAGVEFFEVGNGSSGTYLLSAGTLINNGETIGLSGGVGIFNQSGGVHTTSGITIGDYGSGTYFLSAGSVTASGGEALGYEGSGTFDQSGGVNTIGTAASPASLAVSGVASPSTGNYILSGGTLTVSGIEVVGYSGVGTFTQTGGAHTIGSATSPQSLWIAPGSGSTGSFFVSGTGSLTVNGSAYVGGDEYSPGGSGILSISGGSVSVTDALMIYPEGTLTLAGGTLNVGQLIVESGGTLKLTGGSLNVQTTKIERINAAGFASFTTTKNLTLAGVLALYEDAASEAATTSSQNFVIVQATNGGVLSGAFSNISSGQVLATTDATASFLVTINGGVNGDVVLSDFQAIPEPSAVSLSGIAAVSMLLRRRRRRSSRS